MASPVSEDFQRQHRAAKEYADQMLQVVSQRLANSPFAISDDAREGVMELASNIRRCAERIEELVSVVSQPDFSTTDRDSVSHAMDEIAEPTEDLAAALSELATMEISTRAARSDELSIWEAEWKLVIARLQHAVCGLRVMGYGLLLLLQRQVS